MTKDAAAKSAARLWEFVEKTAKEVQEWPSWKNGEEKPHAAATPKIEIRKAEHEKGR